MQTRKKVRNYPDPAFCGVFRSDAAQTKLVIVLNTEVLFLRAVEYVCRKEILTVSLYFL